MDSAHYNADAWDRLVEKGNRWTQPVSPEEIARARQGELRLVLTPSRPVPAHWLPRAKDLDILCLAGGGGQQGPLLSAAGGRVTVFDRSPKQLEQDRLVAEREGLDLRTVEGDMRDLGAFPDRSFDLVFHPCSNGFCEQIRSVWKEAFRVLRPGGVLLSGFCHPLLYLFDPELEKQGILQLKYRAPYSDLTSLSAEERQRHFPDEPLSFGHTLEDQLGGQTAAGFHLVDFYEDDWGGEQPLDKYIMGFMATRALRPRG